MPSDDIVKVCAHVERTIGTSDQWTRWPGGWPEDIESALVDAVFSARAIYKTERGRGIAHNMAKWQTTRTRSVFSLDALITEIDAASASRWASSFGNLQVSPGRRADAPCGPMKAAAVREAADKLREHDINVASDITVSTTEAAKMALRSVSGIGHATANYFLMLLGVPGVKPDRMIHRFLKDATGHAFTNTYAEQVLQVIAGRFGVQVHKLDHAIWRYESMRSRRTGYDSSDVNGNASRTLSAI